MLKTNQRFKGRCQSYTTSSTKNLEFASVNASDKLTMEPRSVLTLVGDYE